jgi:hypothetical protein
MSASIWLQPFILKLYFNNFKKFYKKYKYRGNNIYLKSTKSQSQICCILVYNKRQSFRFRCVNSAPSNLGIFFLSYVSHYTMYFRLRCCTIKIYIITYVYIFQKNESSKYYFGIFKIKRYSAMPTVQLFYSTVTLLGPPLRHRDTSLC